MPLSVKDPDSGVSRHVTSDVWDYVVNNHTKWRSKHVKPLFITHRDMQEDTSLIVRADDSDALADFVETRISQIPNLRGVWILNMAKIRIVRLPEHRPRDLRRFTVTIDALPKYVNGIYERISGLKPSDEVIITYITQTYQSFRASIMVSVLARSANHIEAFTNDYIRSLPGVEGAEITFISKTLRLVSPEEWLEEAGPYMVSPGEEQVRKIEADDDSFFAAC